MVQNLQALHVAPVAEAPDHFGDQDPIVPEHLVRKRLPNHLALGQSILPDYSQERIEVVSGVQVPPSRTGRGTQQQ